MFRLDKSKISQVSVKNPTEVFNNVLKQVSGSSFTRELKYDIFYQIVAFKGVRDGLGCSTLVANTALALADLGLTVCVVDTSLLCPSQDVLLKTSFSEEQPDWFDMQYSIHSPLGISSYSKNISVLSFKKRSITDAVSPSESDELVTRAFTEYSRRFDIILVDCCHELTEVSQAALQQCQTVIQVWSNDPVTVNNIDNFVNNCAIMACSFGKMRNVVYSRIAEGVIGDLSGVLESYQLNLLATNINSEEVARVATLGRPLYQHISTDEGVENYTECIINIVCFLCGLLNEPMGNFTVNEITSGKVDGTLTKKIVDEREETGKINLRMDLKTDSIPHNMEALEITDDPNKKGDAPIIAVDPKEEVISDSKEDVAVEAKPVKRGFFGRRSGK